VLAGDRLLIWGGTGTSGALGTGGQLIFKTNAPVSPQSWRIIASAGAPSARTDHAAVMAGGKMIVWGGRNGGTLLGDGASYDPVADAWTALPSLGAPSARSGHIAVWTGQEMLIVGGDTATGPTSTGAAYDPAANRWRALPSAGQSGARSGAAAVWTGAELAVFGGQAAGLPIAALQRLNPQPTWYFYRKP
jgi:N-acetylneuraminic acid mutarotase